ncbi:MULTISPECIES: SDR family NAD(P)-dependent oxidoreductase [unclassified Lysinibacillus]|uniref:SDR family NAD(P)-dependent oxidoreductase n=1 Tax=unclassified Lysinibacillus TaxID=2636778 RepID=UPI003811C182
MKKNENDMNKVVLIIGGNSGIGKGIARKFLENSKNIVIITGRDIEKGLNTQEELSRVSKNIEFYPLDINHAQDVENIIKTIAQKYGRIDISCNCAGIEHRFASMIDLEEEEFDKVINVNLKGAWLCMKYQIKQMMRQRNGGSIINISSVSGLKTTPNGSIYSASKHGLEGLTKTAAHEFARFGIRINNVTPGLVQTPMANRVLGISEDGSDELCNKYIPAGRMASTKEIAEAVYWIASDSASYIIGHSLVVDGGLALGR